MRKRLVAFVTLNLLDLVSTASIVVEHGLSAEANPFARWFMEHLGLAAAGVWKMSATGFCATALWRYRDHPATRAVASALVAMYAAVVAWNGLVMLLAP